MTQQVLASSPVAEAARRGIAPRALGALAAGLLLIDDARLYGLIDGGPEIDRSQCQAVLEELRAGGVAPSADDAAAKAIEIMAELGVVRA